jgi:hypothetical protein
VAGKAPHLPLVENDFSRESIGPAQILIAVDGHLVIESEVVASAFSFVPQQAEIGVGTVGPVVAGHAGGRYCVEGPLAGSLLRSELGVGKETGPLVAFFRPGPLVAELAELGSCRSAAQQGNGVGRTVGMGIVTGGAIESTGGVEPESLGEGDTCKDVCRMRGPIGEGMALQANSVDFGDRE